jgi:hypothetical protein
MSLKLTAHQRRVLGVLIEKSLTTPAGYPLTLNSLLVGCNQLTCREPVMSLNEDEVARAVRELEAMNLAGESDLGRGARVERYAHKVEESSRWNPHQQAVMAELLLRGPQTAGELKTNASRMAAIPDLGVATMILEAFATESPPLVRELPRQPGRSAARFDHACYAEGEPQAAAGTPAPVSRGNEASLEARLARLEEEVAVLRRQVESMRP